MISRTTQWFFLPLSLCLISSFSMAQVMTIPSSGFGNIGSHDMGTSGMPVGLDLTSSLQITNNFYGMMTNMQNRGTGETSSSAISKLDLKAPWKARREYDKGYQLLMKKDFKAAVEHLSKAVELYPKFVAAHNALGSAYLSLGQNDQAQAEFSQAVALDDHLPNSHLNLGVAELALKNYGGAEESLKKASEVAPLDLSLQRALAYGQYVNKDYAGVISTAQRVHRRKHEGSAIVHYFAAAAWEAQNNVPEAQKEFEALLREDPKSQVAEQVRQILRQLSSEQTKRAGIDEEAAAPVTFGFEEKAQPTPEEATKQAQRVLQDLREKNQITEAETAEGQSQVLSAATASTREHAGVAVAKGNLTVSGGVLRASVDEVAIFFAATDRGKSVTNLTRSDVGIRDDQKEPAAVLGFRNEAELPLRLGLVIDTSDSVSARFSFEQEAAMQFLQKSVVGQDDLAFVIGVNNSVLLVQDLTGDQSKFAHAVGELVPSGGTALWDAVAFAADKLASRPEVTPVARILVVISDGENNSSSTTLKEAIEHAQHGEVAVYTVSTRDYGNEDQSALIGDHALRTLSELTGGAAFMPGSIRRLNGSLADLQQVIRARYLVAYKPASFQRDGRYRPIEITAEKDGRKLRVYARKGYYASAAQVMSTNQ